MEGLTDTILYIIITIALIAFSFLGKKKKPAEVQRRPYQRPQPEFDPFGEIFGSQETLKDEEDEFVDNAPPERTTVGGPRRSYKPSVVPSPSLKTKLEQTADLIASKQSQTPIEKDTMSIDMKYDWDSEKEKTVEIDFDLKSAIIYSEIITRKYS